MWSNFALKQQAVVAPAPPPAEDVQVTDISEDENLDEVNINNDDKNSEGNANITVANSNNNSIPAEETTATDGWDDDDNFLLDSPTRGISSSTEGGGTTVGQVAQNFGALLAAEIDNDMTEQPREVDNKGGGFGSGFVMKGLSRFIEAATAPQEDEKEHVHTDDNNNFQHESEVGSPSGNGWGDDEDLDFHDDDNEDNTAVDIAADDVNSANEHETLSNVNKSAPTHVESAPSNTSGDGWDDIDISFNSPEPKVSESNIHEGVVTATVPDKNLFPTEATQAQVQDNNQTDDEKDVGSKSGLVDDELNAVVNDNVASEDIKDAAAVVETNSYNYDENKDDSPEPLTSQSDQPTDSTSKLPHQESWYVNAMEDGKGGVVYGEEALQSNLLQTRKGEITPDDGEELEDSSAVETPVGMPLSEMPSEIPSCATSDDENGNISNIKPEDVQIEKSELKCECLELIMPLSTENENGEPQHHKQEGVGTKTLPSGEKVLVNYHKLLENEAKKRILLQRSVESFEHTIQTLKSEYQASIDTSREQENQLSSSHEEISNLKQLVMSLQGEKENMINEAQLFEAELASAVNDKEYLEREVESIQEDLKAKEDYYLNNVELQKNIEVKLQESEAEKTLLVDQVEALQNDCSEVQQERDELKEKVQDLMKAADSTTTECETKKEELANVIESLQQELVEKNNEIEQLTEQIRTPSADPQANSTTKTVDDGANLREEISRLQEENKSLLTIQRERDLQISELKTTIDTLDYDDSGEADKLAAQVASLTYELEMKTTEVQESISTLEEVQAKLDNADARLVELTNAQDQQKHSIDEKVQSLRAENDSLQKQLTDLQGSHTLLEISLDDRETTIKSLEAQIQSLNTESSSALQSLQAKLDDAESRLSTVAVTNNNDLPPADTTNLDEVSFLRKQLADVQGGKSELEKLLKERSSAVDSLETTLNDQNVTISSLRDELIPLRQLLDDNKQLLDDKANEIVGLKNELLDTQSDRAVIVAKNEISSKQAQEQISSLRSQVADLLKDHNTTMKSVEEQLTNSLHQCEEYKMKLESAENKCSNIIQSSDETIAKYIEQVSKLNGQILESSAALQLKESAVTSLQTQLEQQEKEASEAISRCSSVEESSGNVVRQWEERAKSLEATVAELSTALQTTKIALEARQLEPSNTEDDSKVIKLQKSIDSMKLEMDSTAHRHQELLDKNHLLMQEKADLSKSFEAKVTSAEEHIERLKSECATLQSNLEISQKASAETEQQLNDQLQALKDSNTQLEDKLFEASFDSPEGIAEENTSLRRERDELKEQVNSLTQRIDDLTSRADDDNASEKLTELRDELTSIQEERHQLDLDNEELLVQLGLMQQDKFENQAECEVDIETLRERCSDLQNELDEMRRQPSTTAEDDKDQEKLKSLKEKIDQLSGENESLIDQINGLTQRITELEEEGIIQAADGSSGDISDSREEEIKCLRQEKVHLQQQLDSKDIEISKLANECSSKEKELEEVSSKLDASNNEMATFTSKLETLQTQYEQQQEDVVDTSYDEDDDDISLQDLLAEAVLDSDDYLRSQIVVLAEALQRSELQRADALERILRERRTNADSLRQLGESVKRFYITVK